MLLIITVSPMNKYTRTDFILQKLIFFKTKNKGVLIFLVEHYTIKPVIITYYLLQKSTVLNLYNQRYVSQSKNKYTTYIYW